MKIKNNLSLIIAAFIIFIMPNLYLSSDEHSDTAKLKRFNKFIISKLFSNQGEPTTNGFLIRRKTLYNFCSDKDLELKYENEKWQLFDYETQEKLDAINECFPTFDILIRSNNYKGPIYPIFETSEYKQTTTIEEMSKWKNCKMENSSIDCDRVIVSIPTKVTINFFENIVYEVIYSVKSENVPRKQTIQSARKLESILKKSFPKEINRNESKNFDLSDVHNGKSEEIYQLEFIAANELNQRLLFICLLLPHGRDVIYYSITQNSE